MSRTARLRLLLSLVIVAVIALNVAIYHRQEPYYLKVARVTPDPDSLLDPDTVAFCKMVQGDLDQGRFDALNAAAQTLATLRDKFRGGHEKLVELYLAVSDRDCTSDEKCRPEEAHYPSRIRQVQDWLNRDPHQPTANLAMAQIWYSYALAARHCHSWQQTTFDEWRTFYDRIRVARTYLVDSDVHANPEYFLLSLELLRDAGGNRAQIDALYDQGHEAYPRFFTLVAVYSTMLDTQYYGADGDLGVLAESALNDPGGEDGQMEYAIVAAAESGHIPYPHLFLETGLSWPRVKAGYELIEKRYGNSNLDWNVYCYMAMVAIDGPAALNAYSHFGQNWNPAVWENADYFYGLALPWITDGR